MIAVTHFFIGLLTGSFFFGNELFSFQNVLIILVFSNGLDLDHLYKFNSRPKNHLRTFVQEPFGFLIIGVPSAILLGCVLGPIYVWTVLSLYSNHIIADYLCIFDAYPLDPFNKKIVKREGMGIILTLEREWLKRSSNFPNKINEGAVLIGLVCLNIISIYYLFYNNAFLIL
ncbi:MAG: hypothetical protein ACTSRG_01420 [Candidatus Helarchaeota archaeon]